MMTMMTVGQVNDDGNDDSRTGQAKRMAGLPKSHIARGLPTGTARPPCKVEMLMVMTIMTMIRW